MVYILNLDALDITLDKKNDTEALIKITLKEADYQPQVQEKIKDYAKKANMKGFRPGKVPPGLIKRMLGTQFLVEEVQQLLNTKLSDYIKSSDLLLLGEPLPDEEAMKAIDWNTQKDFEFLYEVGFAKEFTYQLPEAGQMTEYSIAVTDEEVEEAVARMRKQHGTMDTPEVATEGDIVFGELKDAEGELLDSVAISPEDMKEDAKGKFEGMKEDDTTSFELFDVLNDIEVATRLISAKTKEEIEAITGEVSFTVSQISRRVPAEFNKEFYLKAVGDDSFESEADFREKVRSDIAANYSRDTNYLLERDMTKAILANTEVEMPEAFLKKLMSKNEELTEEQVEENFDKSVEDLKWSLIRDQIAKEHEIKVGHDEVLNKVKEMFGALNVSPEMAAQMDAFANNYLQQENGENYMRVHMQVMNAKLLEIVREKAEIDQKEVSLDEFKELAQAAQ